VCVFHFEQALTIFTQEHETQLEMAWGDLMVSSQPSWDMDSVTSLLLSGLVVFYCAMYFK
jgi:hypothetical protein